MLLPEYRDVRVVVLGSSGFVGRWVALALQQQKAKLHLVVRSRKPAEAIFSQYGISGEPIQLDLSNEAHVKDFFTLIRPSVVFNMAGYGVDRVERDDRVFFRINAHLLRVICESMPPDSGGWSGQRIVHAGSALEYGLATGNLAETSIPCPTTLYGKSKLAGTSNLKEFCIENGLPGLTARLFTVYGPGEHAGRLLPSLLEAAKSGKPVELTSGMQKRDFTYVGDVAEGLLRLGSSHAGLGEIVNLATGKLKSVQFFAEIAARILGIESRNLKWGTLPSRAEEMTHSNVAIQKLKDLTNWMPETTIEEGIRATQSFHSDGRY